MENRFYILKLNEALNSLKKKYPGYSLRRYARFLKIPASTLALILNGKRPFPKKFIDSTIELLKLDNEEIKLFKESITNSIKLIDKVKIDPNFDNRFVIDESYYDVIAQWEHYALLTLMELDDFVFSSDYILSKLNMTSKRLQEVVETLEKAELIEKDEIAIYKLSKGPLISTTEDISSLALRESHKETLEMAAEKLEDIDVEYRDFSSMTVSLDPKSLSNAKELIRDFRKKFGSLFTTDKKKEVFQMSIQLFPLTKINEINTKALN